VDAIMAEFVDIEVGNLHGALVFGRESRSVGNRLCTRASAVIKRSHVYQQQPCAQCPD
jgi:hypothetical protein